MSRMATLSPESIQRRQWDMFEGLQTDWQAWAPLASEIIALHDVIGHPEQGSVRFAREHIFTDPCFTVLKTVGCMAVLQRR